MNVLPKNVFQNPKMREGFKGTLCAVPTFPSFDIKQNCEASLIVSGFWGLWKHQRLNFFFFVETWTLILFMFSMKSQQVNKSKLNDSAPFFKFSDFLSSFSSTWSYLISCRVSVSCIGKTMVLFSYSFSICPQTTTTKKITEKKKKKTRDTTHCLMARFIAF